MTARTKIAREDKVQPRPIRRLPINAFVEGDPAHSRQCVGLTPIRHLVLASHQPPRMRQHGQTNAYMPLLSMRASSSSPSKGATEMWRQCGKSESPTIFSRAQAACTLAFLIRPFECRPIVQCKEWKWG